MVFGNQGALYMTNMTWWDHQTESIWVQMTGRAARGPLTGATLSQLPAYTGPWSTWVAEHPDTEVLIPVAGSIRLFHERPRDDFVVGVTLDGDAAAYYYGPLAERGLINDEVGGVPIVVYADVETRSIKTYARAIGGNVLTFELAEGKLRDLETGSVWNPLTGFSESGPKQGELLRQVPYTPAFDWSWKDFHPESRFLPA